MQVTYHLIEHSFSIYLILIDGEPWRQVHRNFFNQGSFPKSCDYIKELEVLLRETENKKALAYALKRLSSRSYPTSELKKWLEKSFLSAPTIQTVLQECTRLGYLNDQAWIHYFINSHLRRGIGPKIILMKLKLKGLPEALIQTELTLLAPLENQLTAISNWLTKRFRLRDFNKKEKDKAMAALLRKGFDFSSIIEGFNIINLTKSQ